MREIALLIHITLIPPGPGRPSTQTPQLWSWARPAGSNTEVRLKKHRMTDTRLMLTQQLNHLAIISRLSKIKALLNHQFLLRQRPNLLNDSTNVLMILGKPSNFEHTITMERPHFRRSIPVQNLKVSFIYISRENIRAREKKNLLQK